MEVPAWLFLAVLLGGVLLTILIAASIDIFRGTPDVVLKVLIPILLVTFFGGLFWLSSRDRLLRHRRLAQTSTAHRLMMLMPDEMADIAAELYRMRGYAVTENKRPDLEDGGVDFEVSRDGKTWLVQVKHWRQEVTVKEARELWGIVASEGAAGGILIGTSGFTSPAWEFAEEKDLALIDGPEFLKLRSEVPTLHSGDRAADPILSEGSWPTLTAFIVRRVPNVASQWSWSRVSKMRASLTNSGVVRLIRHAMATAASLFPTSRR